MSERVEHNTSRREKSAPDVSERPIVGVEPVISPDQRVTASGSGEDISAVTAATNAASSFVYSSPRLARIFTRISLLCAGFAIFGTFNLP